MAIECERKYVIRPERFSELLRRIDEFGLIPEFIRQTYLDPDGYGRVRKSIRPDRATRGYQPDERAWRMSGYNPTAVPDTALTQYTFTYKSPTGDDYKRLEFEHEIDRSDYEDAINVAKAVGIPSLYKLRHSDRVGSHRWDTDLFYERWSAPDQCPGFVLGLVEVEMPLGQIEPPTFPEYLAKVGPVLLDTVLEREFSNFRLAKGLERVVRSDMWRFL